MGDVAEQRDDGKPGTEPGTDIEPASGGSAAQPPAVQPPAEPELDPEQLRQFQQFQQFQDYLRFTQAQQGNQPAPVPNGGVVSQQPPSGPPAVPPGGELVPAKRPLPKAPRWLKWLARKILGWIIAIVLLGIAATWAYNHFFPSRQDDDRPASETGGGQYHQYDSLPKSPYEAVRAIYDFVYRKDPLACTRFTDAARQQFTADLHFASCEQAVQELGKQVTDPWAYGFSIPSAGKEGTPTSPISISSCTYNPQGGPALGTFMLTQVERGQWLIIGHQPDPSPCPAAAGTR